MKAFLKNYRQSPRKVRAVSDMVRGKRVPEAVAMLAHIPKRAGLPLKKLIESAAANAKSIGTTPENLVISDIRVDGGFVFKRIDPRARGSAYLIRKRTSHVRVVLSEAKEKQNRKSTQKQKAKA